VSSELTEQELAEMEARANAATSGPWAVSEYKDDRDGLTYRLNVSEDCTEEMNVNLPICRTCRWDMSVEEMRCNAEFIAHARTDVPLLIAEVRRLRELLNICPCCGQ
jgi:hypothetical protein